MVRFGVLLVGCLTFLGLASLAIGPLQANTPPPASPVLAVGSSTPAATSATTASNQVQSGAIVTQPASTGQ